MLSTVTCTDRLWLRVKQASSAFLRNQKWQCLCNSSHQPASPRHLHLKFSPRMFEGSRSPSPTSSNNGTLVVPLAKIEDETSSHTSHTHSQPTEDEHSPERPFKTVSIAGLRAIFDPKTTKLRWASFSTASLHRGNGVYFYFSEK